MKLKGNIRMLQGSKLTMYFKNINGKNQILGLHKISGISYNIVAQIKFSITDRIKFDK